MLNPKKYFSGYLNTKKLHPIAIDRAKEVIQIIFSAGTYRKDITESHALISLKPFAIAINAAAIDFPDAKNISLQICEGENKLGELLLKPEQTRPFASVTLKIFEAMLSPDSYPMATKAWNLLMLHIKNAIDKKSKNFIVPPPELMKLFVYTLKPRPVFIISIEHKNGFDAFPIDIFGKISDDLIILAIRSTSATIPFILATRKLCACSVPFDLRKKAYKLGRHHAGGVLPPDFDTGEFTRSAQLQIPIPEFAVSVQELVLEDSFVKGAHTQFIARIINSYRLSEGPELAHTPWFNTNYF